MGVCGSNSSPKKANKNDLLKQNSNAENNKGERYSDNAQKMNKQKSNNSNLVQSKTKMDNDDIQSKNRNKKKKFKFLEADDSQMYENIQIQNQKMSAKDTVFNVKSLIGHFFFSNLSNDELESVVERMFFCTTAAGQYVFKQGDDASCFFIIQKGSVAVEIDGVEKKKLSKDQGFGELALLYNAPRSASIKADQDCCFWAIDRTTFKKVVEEVTTKQFRENREFLNKINFFNSMTDSQKDAIAGVILNQKFILDQIIFNEGDQASSYYIIKSGTVDCVQNNVVVRQLQEGDSFGEQALYESGHRTLSVKANNKCSCLALSRGDLQNILGAKIQQVIQGNWSRWAIEKSEIFCKMTKLQIEKWIQNTTIQDYDVDTIIAKKDTRLSNIVIVISGEATFGPMTFARGSTFGGEFMYPSENLNKKYFSIYKD